MCDWPTTPVGSLEIPSQCPLQEPLSGWLYQKLPFKCAWLRRGPHLPFCPWHATFLLSKSHTDLCGSKARLSGEISIAGDVLKKFNEPFLPSKSKEIVILNHMSLQYKNLNHVILTFLLVGLLPWGKCCFEIDRGWPRQRFSSEIEWDD